MKFSRLRILLSALWLIFTISLVSWWFIFALRNLNTEDMTDAARHYRMLFFEGSTLIVSILVGGVVIIFLSIKDDQRHERLKYFFSNFTHDIKTSIARLRLQADILSEQNENKNNRVIQRLLNDISKLDLQLENSLLLTHVNEAIFLDEKINFKSMIDSVQIEFEEIKISIKQEAEINADSRALKSIIRNILENSRRHGKASEVHVQLSQIQQNKIKIIFEDNGVGTTQLIKSIGHEIRPSSSQAGTGIGLFLATQLIQKMSGSISFSNGQAVGFKTELILKGYLV